MAVEDSDDRVPFGILIMPNAHRQILTVSAYNSPGNRVFDHRINLVSTRGNIEHNT